MFSPNLRNHSLLLNYCAFVKEFKWCKVFLTNKSNKTLFYYFNAFSYFAIIFNRFSCGSLFSFSTNFLSFLSKNLEKIYFLHRFDLIQNSKKKNFRYGNMIKKHFYHFWVALTVDRTFEDWVVTN